MRVLILITLAFQKQRVLLLCELMRVREQDFLAMAFVSSSLKFDEIGAGMHPNFYLRYLLLLPSILLYCPKYWEATSLNHTNRHVQIARMFRCHCQRFVRHIVAIVVVLSMADSKGMRTHSKSVKTVKKTQGNETNN